MKPPHGFAAREVRSRVNCGAPHIDKVDALGTLLPAKMPDLQPAEGMQQRALTVYHDGSCPAHGLGACRCDQPLRGSRLRDGSSAAFAVRLVAAGVDRDVRGAEGASDHAPAWIELS